MKIVTLDYGCGTSSSILDYNINDVIVISEKEYSHVYEIQDDLFFIGHDFLFFLWDSQEKVEKWKSHRFQKSVWCFERVDAIVPAWMQKSHYSLSMFKQFSELIFAADEDDCNKYGFKWLPQWSSRIFFDKKDKKITKQKILFSGQAGKPEYHLRNSLLQKIVDDKETKDLVSITNIQRSLSWTEYVENLLAYPAILNPYGVVKACNTRAYETLISGRVLLQQADKTYTRHKNLLSKYDNVIFFENFDELKSIILNTDFLSIIDNDPKDQFNNNNLLSRFSNIGIDLK